MKFRIYFEIENQEDHFDIEGDTLEKIQEKVRYEINKRGLNEVKNNFRSEVLPYNSQINET